MAEYEALNPGMPIDENMKHRRREHIDHRHAAEAPILTRDDNKIFRFPKSKDHIDIEIHIVPTDTYQYDLGGTNFCVNQGRTTVC